jgi:hypothetical protein
MWAERFPAAADVFGAVAFSCTKDLCSIGRKADEPTRKTMSDACRSLFLSCSGQKGQELRDIGPRSLLPALPYAIALPGINNRGDPDNLWREYRV